jgi:hypothetical protein
LTLKLCGYVLRLGVNETPNLIALNALAREIAEMLALVCETCHARIGHEFKHRILR